MILFIQWNNNQAEYWSNDEKRKILESSYHLKALYMNLMFINRFCIFTRELDFLDKSASKSMWTEIYF